MLIFVQVCKTIDKNLSVFISSIGFGRTNESNGIYKRSLCCKKASKEKSVWRSSEAEDWKLKFVKVVILNAYGWRRDGSLEQRIIREDFEGIWCLSTEERRKRSIVQLYNHYSTTSFFKSAIVQEYRCTYAGYALYIEWIWNCSFIGQNQIKQQIIDDLIKLHNDSSDVLAISNIFLTPLYKGVKTWRLERLLQQFYKCQTYAEIVLHQSSLRIS